MSLATVSLLVTSCDDDDDDLPGEKITYNISGAASGSQEVPAVTTAATGSITGTYNKNTNVLNFTITWSGLSANIVGMHFHGPAVAGENASVAIGITGAPTTTSGTHTGSVTLTDAHETDLLAGRWYYNIHTSTNANGEIRGQITAQ